MPHWTKKKRLSISRCSRWFTVRDEARIIPDQDNLEFAIVSHVFGYFHSTNHSKNSQNYTREPEFFMRQFKAWFGKISLKNSSLFGINLVCQFPRHRNLASIITAGSNSAWLMSWFHPQKSILKSFSITLGVMEGAKWNGQELVFKSRWGTSASDFVAWCSLKPSIRIFHSCSSIHVLPKRGQWTSFLPDTFLKSEWKNMNEKNPTKP